MKHDYTHAHMFSPTLARAVWQAARNLIYLSDCPIRKFILILYVISFFFNMRARTGSAGNEVIIYEIIPLIKQ